MKTVKEKLMNLIQHGGFKCGDDAGTFANTPCDGCRYEAEEDCAAARTVDALIEGGVTIQEWVSVDERLPEFDEDVLVWGHWHEKYQTLKCHYSSHREGHWFTAVAGQEVYSVTHWMPLPALPKEKENHE